MFQILLWSPWTYRCGQRTVRLAVVACSQSQAVFARRRSKPKLKLLDIRAELEREKKNARVAFSQRSSSRRLIEDETFNDSDIVNNLIDYEDGQEERDSLRADKNMQRSSFPTNWKHLQATDHQTFVTKTYFLLYVAKK
ncbi:hypothetical protein TNCV_2669041 [Trichonephila clavipes]|nr:hypothetical protein TNCV_2669041 [Trichonephila clavipes]